MSLVSATQPPSASGARLTGDDTQHAIAWYYALLSLRPRADIISIAVEAANAGNVDDVVIRHASSPDDYLQVKAAVSAAKPATTAWLTTPTPSGGPSILQRFHQFFTRAAATGRSPHLQLITSRSIDPDDPVLTLRDRTERIAEPLRRATTRRVTAARTLLAEQLKVSDEELCSFLDYLRFRTDASEATWAEKICHLSVALGLEGSDQAVRLGVSEVRDWVKRSRSEKSPAEIHTAVDRLGLCVDEPWETLVVQALDTEADTQDATVALDWVDRFVGDEARTRRGLRNPDEWDTILGPGISGAELAMQTKRVLVRGQARLPVWFAVGTRLGRTRGYHVAKMQNGELWSTDLIPPALPDLITSTLREPTPGEPLGLSIAVSADPSTDATQYLVAHVSDAGHLRIALRTGIGSHAIKGADHAWATALAIRDEVRRIAAHLRPSVLHLFLATPAALALLIGHVWDRVPDTQTYEDLVAAGYAPAFLIRN